MNSDGEGAQLWFYVWLLLQHWKKMYSKMDVRKNSVFANLGYYGLISFSDYLFLLTIISSESSMCTVSIFWIAL